MKNLAIREMLKDFGKFYPSQHLGDATIELWAEKLKDYSMEQIKTALERIKDTNDRLPGFATLKQTLPSLSDHEEFHEPGFTKEQWNTFQSENEAMCRASEIINNKQAEDKYVLHWFRECVNSEFGDIGWDAFRKSALLDLWAGNMDVKRAIKIGKEKQKGNQ